MNIKKMELLAPAGSFDSVLAAVRCGANAVYLGMSAFNARRHAKNFESTDALAAAVDYCHIHGVKVYLTLNTLILECEMEQALEVAHQAISAGVDAFIVQDVGLAKRLRASAPDIRLHASTQLSCHTPEGVKSLVESGFSRVVLAREMSADEIKACVGLGAELEVFVHGALCMSVSGQCYLSAMLGGRSGNRGACAQPCRLPFAASGTKAQDTYALSLKDQSLVEHIETLREIGVDSLKIEGRMKRPEYVAAAVTVCAAAVKGEQPVGVSQEELQAVFSRTGFTDGYFTGKRTDMFGIRRQEDASATASVVSRLANLYAKERAHIPVRFSMDLSVGHVTVLKAIDMDGHTAQVTGPCGEAAISHPLEPERVKAALSKTGGTPFMVENIDLHMHPCVVLPISALNAMRREAIERLTALRQRISPIDFDSSKVSPKLNRYTYCGKPKMIARLSGTHQWSAACAADAVVLPLSAFEKTVNITADEIWAEIPRGLFGSSHTLKMRLQHAKAQGVTRVLCHNIGAIQPVLEAGMQPVGGFGLNITNSDALAFYQEKGLTAATLSMEMTFSQMSFAKEAAIPCGIMVYGRQPLMLMRNCPRRSGNGCGNTGCSEGLIDRKGVRFPLACEGGCTELLNSSVLYWADKRHEIPMVEYWLLHFTDETPETVAQTVEDYRFGGKPRDNITRGLYRRGLVE